MFGVYFVDERENIESIDDGILFQIYSISYFFKAIIFRFESVKYLKN